MDQLLIWPYKIYYVHDTLQIQLPFKPRTQIIGYMSMPEFKATRHEKYRTINVNGMFGGVRMGYIEATVYSEHSDFEKAMALAQIDKNKMEVHRIIECRLVFDPIQLKSTAIWFNNQVEQYEKLFGSIPSPEEVANKQKRSKDQ